CWQFFFFQAEDGIRDFHVTGVQTCALPISLVLAGVFSVSSAAAALELNIIAAPDVASWIERNASRFSERVGQEVNISVKQIWGRSEERRVGKEWRDRWVRWQYTKKGEREHQ